MVTDAVTIFITTISMIAVVDSVVWIVALELQVAPGVISIINHNNR